MAREGKLFQQTVRWGESIEARLAGSSAAMRPQDSLNWASYAASTAPSPFPMEIVQQSAQQLRQGSSALSPLALQQQINTVLPLADIKDFLGNLGGLIGGNPNPSVPIGTTQPTANTPYNFPTNTSLPGSTPYHYPTSANPNVVPSNTGYSPSGYSPYDVGSGKAYPMAQLPNPTLVDYSNPLGGIVDGVIDHYKNAGQNIGLGILAIGLVLLGGYALVK